MQLEPIKTYINSVLNALKSNAMVAFIVILLTFISFFAGSMWTKVQFYERGFADPSAVAKNDAAAVGNGGTAAAGNGAGTGATAPSKDNLAKPTDKDHTRGSATAEIALIEYSDFSCPFCKQFYVTATQAINQYNGKVKWVYRNFPLPSLHPNAQKQAQAAECATKLGGDSKFWAYSDKINAYSSEVTVDVMKKFAGELGLDQPKFNSCLDNDETKAIVDADQQSGIKAGVNGTPGNFLMNLKTGEVVALKGAVPLDSLKSSIDAMLK